LLVCCCLICKTTAFGFAYFLLFSPFPIAGLRQIIRGEMGKPLKPKQASLPRFLPMSLLKKSRLLLLHQKTPPSCRCWRDKKKQNLPIEREIQYLQNKSPQTKHTTGEPRCCCCCCCCFLGGGRRQQRVAHTPPTHHAMPPQPRRPRQQPHALSKHGRARARTLAPPHPHRRPAPPSSSSSSYRPMFTSPSHTTHLSPPRSLEHRRLHPRLERLVVQLDRRIRVRLAQLLLPLERLELRR
jgi:hypothetical protein